MKPLPDLAEVEQRFQAFVLDRRPGIESAIVADTRAGALDRLNVYADAYRLRLLETLGKDYPALCALLGEAEFNRLGHAYIDAHPSDTPSIRWFGRHFPVFLQQELPQRPALSELAAFEWAQGEVFDAPDASVLRVEDMARIPPDAWPRMRLTLHPAVRRLDLRWNAPAIAQAFAAKTPAPAPRAGPTPVAWLLWRQSLDIRWRSLESGAGGEADAIDAAQHGASFSEICERLCAHIEPDQAALHAASLLKRWVADGIVGAAIGANGGPPRAPSVDRPGRP